MTEYSYPALLLKQTNSAKPILLFAAPAAQIDKWAGVPQKKRFSDSRDDETIGFQREENPKRITSLGHFFEDEQNAIQNPLLCATRVLDKEVIRFEPAAGQGERPVFGTLFIKIPDYSQQPFQELLGLVREYLESRVPELKANQPGEKIVLKLKERARQDGHIAPEDPADETAEDTSDNAADETSEQGDLTAVLFEESHIYDFWEEVAARHEVAKLIPQPLTTQSFLGFSRSALAAYVLPVVLVDGQHRLKGALAAATAKLSTDSLRAEIEERIVNGESPDSVDADLMVRESRWLPVSLLMSDEPSEQVFQFVVVNQKATPIGRALLGTIVSTTLSKDEMDKVASRLKNAGIELEESQAISYLIRHKESPFYDRVQRGMTGDGKDLLEWNVFASLIAIFRDLRGGKLYGEKNDYADIWRKKYLDDSPIVKDYADHGQSDPFKYWSRIDGPWRAVFIRFWTEVRDYFGQVDDVEAPNYWGKPRQSNLFNKPSLTILAADFFQYLTERKSTIESPEHISTLVAEWLDGVKGGYFNRDWNLASTKKDVTGIKNQWAFLWNQYRKNPEQFPQAKLYKQTKAD
ncbi:hypothetical protein [Burkholderia pseudomallei]|uniref:hypothetical protein n=1 Tax=Burkholderia pseudomallei TaxID=28450 RepID=UPI0018C51A18|nr:hypothetical protein [Burkholderia pseudomallei]MBG1252215.1 hypothetical protein [Burkholderia pseudomallei]